MKKILSSQFIALFMMHYIVWTETNYQMIAFFFRKPDPQIHKIQSRELIKHEKIYSIPESVKLSESTTFRSKALTDYQPEQ